MSRRILSGLIAVAIFAPALHADVKTKEKTQVKFEGMLGRIAGMAGGGAAKDGLTNSVAVKGNRMATFNDQNGQIVDLAEEKVYHVDVKKKEYRVFTFAEMREQMQKMKADSLADLVKIAVRLGLAPARNPWHVQERPIE